LGGMLRWNFALAQIEFVLIASRSSLRIFIFTFCFELNFSPLLVYSLPSNTKSLFTFLVENFFAGKMLRNPLKHLLSTRLWSQKCRFVSSAEFPVECEDEFMSIKKRKRIKEPIQGHKDVINHFSHPDKQIALNYPPELLKRYNKKNSIESFYLSDKSAVDIIFEALMKDLGDRDLYEVNPGLGLLTDKLINGTNNKLTLFESDKRLKEQLEVRKE
jgi:hypothetical protein